MIQHERAVKFCFPHRRLARDHARELMAYFRSTLEDLVERVNDCEKIEELGINWKKPPAVHKSNCRATSTTAQS